MKRWILAGAGVLVVVALGATVAYALLFRAEPPATAAQPAAPETTTNLSTLVQDTGSLGYGAPSMFTGRRPGTLTELPPIGTVVKQGQRLYEVDAKPVALFIGDTPLYRKLDKLATPGPDVEEVNANLRELGYTSAPTGDEFTERTEHALKCGSAATGSRTAARSTSVTSRYFRACGSTRSRHSQGRAPPRN